MSVLLAGFVKGATGRALDSIDERRKLENEERKARMLAELELETRQADALFQENLPSKKLARQREEQAMRLNELKDAREERKLSLDIANTDRDNARLDRVANAQIGSYNRSGRDGGGGRGSDNLSDDTLKDRISIANRVTNNLESMGYTPNEVRRARAKLVEGAQKGWSLDQFVKFESTYMQDPALLDAARSRDAAARIEALKKARGE